MSPDVKRSRIVWWLEGRIFSHRRLIIALFLVVTLFMPTMAEVATKDLYKLFPKKPAKKMSYVAGLQKPTGCV